MDYDYQKYTILYVDDEEKSLKYFKQAFEDDFDILTAPSAEEGLEILKEDPARIAILMTDQRMPGMQGTELLGHVRKINPDILRILVTAYADLDSAIDAVNSGAVYKYINKPWNVEELEVTLFRTMEYFLVQRERDRLLEQKFAALQSTMNADRIAGMGVLAAGLNHHIRNAITSVKTFVDLVPYKLAEETRGNEPVDPEFWENYRENAVAELDRIMQILSSFWQASTETEWRFDETIKLHEAVHAAAELFADHFKEKDITLDIDIPSSLPSLRVNEEKMKQLFRLLFQDELTHVPHGGEISVSAESFLMRGEPGVRLTITNDAPQIPEEKLRVLFEPFYIRTEKPDALGVNLMACYQIAHHHGGYMEASNAVPDRTAILLALPSDPEKGRDTISEQTVFQRVNNNIDELKKLEQA